MAHINCVCKYCKNVIEVLFKFGNWIKNKKEWNYNKIKFVRAKYKKNCDTISREQLFFFLSSNKINVYFLLLFKYTRVEFTGQSLKGPGQSEEKAGNLEPSL